MHTNCKPKITYTLLKIVIQKIEKLTNFTCLIATHIFKHIVKKLGTKQSIDHSDCSSKNIYPRSISLQNKKHKLL